MLVDSTASKRWVGAVRDGFSVAWREPARSGELLHSRYLELVPTVDRSDHANPTRRFTYVLLLVALGLPLGACARQQAPEHPHAQKLSQREQSDKEKKRRDEPPTIVAPPPAYGNKVVSTKPATEPGAS